MRTTLIAGLLPGLFGCHTSGVTPAVAPSDDEGARLRERVPHQTLAQDQGGFTDQIRLVVRDSGLWSEVWSRVYQGSIPEPPRPAIDFERQVVLVVGMGEQPSTGYLIIIDSVTASPRQLQAHVRSWSAAEDCVAGMAITAPVYLATIPATDRPIVFVEREVVGPGCSPAPP